MTPVARRVVWSLVAAVVILGAGVAALVTFWPRGPQGVPPQLVPAAWAQYRTSPGHAFHVSQGKAECRDCHDVERDGFKSPGTDVCKKCHVKESARAHLGGPGLAATSCLTCHQFAPGLPAPTCIGCHAKPEGDLSAVVQHATAECTKCHRPHDNPSIVPADCASCHDERATKHGEHAGSKGCLDCHGAHRPATAATVACSSCHAQPAGPHPAGHDSCIGCHQPHDFVAGGEQACIRCHGEKTTLAANVAPAHAICTSCHTPHDPARAATACVRCHQDIQVEHGAQEACGTCHTPHGDDAAVVAVSCTSCHAKVAVFDTAAHAGGVACEGCHKPHHFAGLSEKALCGNCHARETTLVATNAGHADCRSCHGAEVAHAPAPPVACGTCHPAEEKSAPAGHQRCVGCHEPHAGQPLATCATCHADKTAGPHATIPGGCETCHRPHGPSGVAAPPGCKTCHAPSSLPALHAAAGHAECSNCHVSSHAPPRSDRATCTGNCHLDKRDHQPTAQVCTGCHVFRR